MASANAIPTKLGATIKITAIKKGMTLKEVATLFGFRHGTQISMIINGSRPPGKHIIKIAEFLNLTEEEVLALHYQSLIPEKKSKAKAS